MLLFKQFSVNLPFRGIIWGSPIRGKIKTLNKFRLLPISIIRNNYRNIMTTNGHKILKLKERIKSLEGIVEKEPVILISGSDEVWISEKAKEKLLEKKIDTAEFLKQLKVGAKRIKNLSYCSPHACIIPLPEKGSVNDVLVILCEKLCDANNKKHALTKKEKEVLTCLVNGLSNKSIASTLNVSTGTINTHLDNIYRKLGVSNRAAATCSAIKLGIVLDF